MVFPIVKDRLHILCIRIWRRQDFISGEAQLHILSTNDF